MGGVPDDGSKNMLFGQNQKLLKPHSLDKGAIGTSKRVDSSGINGLAVRLQKLYFMKALFLKLQKLKKVKSRY